MSLLNTKCFKNFVPKTFMTCDDKDPPWVNGNNKNKTKCKNGMYKNYKKNGWETGDYELLTEAVSEVSQLVEKSNDEYFYSLGKQLSNPSTSVNLIGLF